MVDGGTGGTCWVAEDGGVKVRNHQPLGMSFNHNQTLVRPVPGIGFNHNQTLVRGAR